MIRVAERLMAEHGVEAVDLKEIQLRAGQRNRSAVNYHFGDRAGLVAAIIDKHRVAMNEQRHRLLDAFEQSGSRSVRALLDAGVAPHVALMGVPSGRDYMIIVAERAGRMGTTGLFAARSLHTDSVQRLNRLLFELLPGSRAERERLVGQAVLTLATLLADVARAVNRDEITVRQGKRRVRGIVEFVVRALAMGPRGSARGGQG
jgi:AcrR family transcriptional regulator